MICVAFIILICGITIARIRNNSDGARVNGESGRKRNGDKHQPVKVMLLITKFFRRPPCYIKYRLYIGF